MRIIAYPSCEPVSGGTTTASRHWPVINANCLVWMPGTTGCVYPRVQSDHFDRIHSAGSPAPAAVVSKKRCQD
ncbi:hypothetical protein M404DRAFT_711739 [Pisolithus tinctorius Marx 270]|uniref:Uncharacterized protein n=1 Tax=Pisolithus tinctorius Marx 270 TaxID=870435 RepID=A0A0C3P3K7_PISTI|nr:hypothetical protein M404DRAFT_711739 [Pisolithus tinctorius Marx 270]